MKRMDLSDYYHMLFNPIYLFVKSRINSLSQTHHTITIHPKPSIPLQHNTSHPDLHPSTIHSSSLQPYSLHFLEEEEPNL